tara:strand:- start:31666 stop:34395 length:2730 start_codon:yes stop_codon:yes gene_type:complete
MEAVLHVQNLAFCKIEIEDSPMPASFNLIDHIVIQEGFGIAVPTLTLYLFDQTGSLQNEMNLVQGTKCTISLARNGQQDRIIKRTFSLWGMTKGVTDSGPHLQVTFILEVPKWSAGVYCENFRGSSDNAMSQIASRAGLKYSGPGGTDDNMNWLNVNTTRSNFSEDVAMRGYRGTSSCMARVLTMNSELRYKDIFEKLKEQETGTLLLNMEDEGPNPYPVKETEHCSLSGVMAHWFNYGQIQHEHSLDSKGQQKTDKISAPVLGDSFPLSDRIKGMISDAVAARVTYTGMDPGTEPKPNSNIHNKYETAFYQNLRGLGLFCERIRSMITVMSDIYSLDCVHYKQRDPVGHQFVPSKTINGKYLVAGKTIRIKNGHVYSEVLDLVRPYVSNPGMSNQTSGAQGRTQVPANEGPFDLASEREQRLSETPVANAMPRPTVDPAANEVDSARGLMNSLEEYDSVNPAIPDTPLGGPGGLSPSSPVSLSGAKIRNAIGEVNRVNRTLSDVIDSSNSGFDPTQSHTIKRIASEAISTSANGTINAMKRYAEETGRIIDSPENLPDSFLRDTIVSVEKPILDRYSMDGTELKEDLFRSIVSPVSAVGLEVDDLLGDIQNGGVFVEDFLRNGLDDPSSFFEDKAVNAIEQVANKGANFAFPASQFGLGASDVAINPKKVADFVIEYAESNKNPQEFLKEKGAEAYQRVFGNKPPTDAKTAIDDLGEAAKRVAEKFGDNEFLVDGANAVSDVADIVTDRNVQTVFDEDASKERRLKAARDALSIKDPTATIKTSRLGGFESSTRLNVDKAIEIASRRSGDTDYSETLDFQFGQTGVSPLVERVVSKGRDQEYSEAEVIETVREALSWAQYTRIGNNEAKKQGTEDEEHHWEFPFSIPFEIYEEGEGIAFDISDAPPDF